MSLTVEKIREDIAVLAGRRDQAHQDYHQVIGAISILEQMIWRLENPEMEQPIDESAAVMDVLPVEEQAAA
jgi:hypothetical protein